MGNVTMIKKVNVFAPIPVRTLNPIMCGKYENISMTSANILKCILAKATVHEILSDGSLLELNMTNYNTVNKPPEPKKVYKCDVHPRLESKPGSMIKKDDKPVMKRLVYDDKIEINDEVESHFVRQRTPPNPEAETVAPMVGSIEEVQKDENVTGVSLLDPGVGYRDDSEGIVEQRKKEMEKAAKKAARKAARGQ